MIIFKNTLFVDLLTQRQNSVGYGSFLSLMRLTIATWDSLYQLSIVHALYWHHNPLLEMTEYKSPMN